MAAAARGGAGAGRRPVEGAGGAAAPATGMRPNGFVNIKAFVVERDSLLSRERDFVTSLGMVQAGLSWHLVNEKINAAEDNEMKRRRRGTEDKRTHVANYKKYSAAREKASQRNYKNEDLLIEDCVRELNVATSSGVFPGTTFQMNFRF